MQILSVLVPLAISVAVSAVPTEQAPLTGINCNGSGLCGSAGATLGQLVNLANSGVDSNRQFGDGQQILCLSHLCAFFQNTGTTNSGARAKELLQGLLNHGCGACGSNPTLPGNDVSTGELTVNYVNSPICQGVC